jgi:hypothetical protein
MLTGFPAIYFAVFFMIILGGVLLVVLLAVTLLTAIRALRTFTRAQELQIDLLLIEKD